MKRSFLLLSIFSICSFLSKAQIVVDFEDAELNDTSFMAGGFEWKLTEDFLISEFENFSCDGSSGFNRYMDSGYLDGGSEGVIGSVAPVNSDVVFQMYTAGSQCIWVANTDGEFTSTGTIRFTGIKMDNSSVEESFELTSTNFNDLIAVDFSENIWSGVDLTSLQIEITDTQDSTDYIAIDNLTFESITLFTSTEELSEQKVDISPNPTNHVIFVKTESPAWIDILDATGKVIRQSISTDQEIDISYLAQGIYFIRVNLDGYQKIEKIIKQ